FAAHARDELGLADHVVAKPVQAALTSAATFSVGAAVPVALAVISPAESVSWLISGGSLLCLAILGGIGATLGGAEVLRPTVRVTFWGALPMAATAVIGKAVGHAI